MAQAHPNSRREQTARTQTKKTQQEPDVIVSVRPFVTVDVQQRGELMIKSTATDIGVLLTVAIQPSQCGPIISSMSLRSICQE